MSTHFSSACRTNLLTKFVQDPEGIPNLCGQDVSMLSIYQIQQIAQKNPAFAAKVESLKPMKDRMREYSAAQIFFKTPGLVGQDFVESMKFELAKPPEQRRCFLYEACIQHVLEKAADNKQAYLLSLNAVSISRTAGLFQQTLLCNPSLMHVLDLGPFLVNLCNYEESYEENLQVFCGLYDLKKIHPESLAKVLCKVAEFKNAKLFEDLCTTEIFDRLPLFLKCNVAISALNIAQHPVFPHIWSQVHISQMNPSQVITGLKIAASLSDYGNFKQLLSQSLDGSHDLKNVEIAKCAFLQSAQFTDPSIFNGLVVHAKKFQISASDLGQMLEYASSCCNEEVIAFVFHEEKSSAIDEYCLGRALIKAAKTENISLAARVLQANRARDIASSCIETAFIEGVVKKHSKILLERLGEHKLLCKVHPQVLCQALTFYAKEGDGAPCCLLIASVGTEIIHAAASIEDLAKLLEIYVELDLCDLITKILETKLLERLPFPIMQRLFDIAFAKRNRAMLRVMLYSSKSLELSPVSIFEAIKRLIELGHLSFFEIAAIEFLQAIPTRFSECSPLQKVELIRVIANLAITVDCSAVLNQIIAMEEFQRFNQRQIDTAILYARRQNRSNCLDVMLTPRYFNRVSGGVAKQFSYEPK